MSSELTTQAEPLVFHPGDVLAVDHPTADAIARAGGRLHPNAAAGLSNRRGQQKASTGTVAVIPIAGFILQHATFFGFGTSTEDVTSEIRRAVATKHVSSIVLMIASNGGGTFGLTELAAVIREARGVKPVVAAVNSHAFSAAYYIAAQASEIIVTPGGQAGSVGVFAMHVDESKALDRAGLAVTLIASDPSKVYGNAAEPLADEARAELQREVDRFYRMFVADVAAGRGLSPKVVRGWRALTYGAKDAVRLGLADRVGTAEQAISRAAALGRAVPIENELHALRARQLIACESNAERRLLEHEWAMRDRESNPRPADRIAANVKREAELSRIQMGSRL